MKRDKFTTRTIRLCGPVQLKTALALLPNLPLDADKPLELVVREEVKRRGQDQNARMWAGPLKDIAEQAWLGGRQYCADVWHEYFKRNVMPETITTSEGETRSKWIESPDGSMVVISTTKLERKCFADYLTAIEAFGASLGVQFSANPKEQP